MNTPTLCLVMDGEKIVCWEILTEREQITRFLNRTTALQYTLKTIPLSQCALVPEMVDGLRKWMKVESESREENPCPDYGLMRLYRDDAKSFTKSLLSKLQPSAESQS